MEGSPLQIDAEGDFSEQKRALFELMHRLRGQRFGPPHPEGLTGSETFVLIHLAHARVAGREVRPGALARKLRLTPSALSQTLKTLESKGLIVRTRAGSDSRAVSVDITDEGWERCAQARRVRDEQADRLLAYLGSDDVDALVRILRRIVEYKDEGPSEGEDGARAAGACPCPEGLDEPELTEPDAGDGARHTTRAKGEA